jgi:hypothetical protein
MSTKREQEDAMQEGSAHEGGCRCGKVRYRFDGAAAHACLCHCEDCRRSAGAPVVGWAAVPAQTLTVTGETVRYQSSALATREFCGTCGTGLFYRNETVLPGLVDVQMGTLDDPEKLPPSAHIQTAERISWMAREQELPAFERYPG